MERLCGFSDAARVEERVPKGLDVLLHRSERPVEVQVLEEHHLALTKLQRLPEAAIDHRARSEPHRVRQERFGHLDGPGAEER